MQEISRVLITGGSGFIGTNLVDYLERLSGIEILNVDKVPPRKPSQGVHWKMGDIMDEGQVQGYFLGFRPSHVIHLAARTDLDENESLDDYAVNTLGTENILRAVNRNESVQRVIVTSSMLISAVGGKVSSDEDYCPPNLYGQSKVLTEIATRQMGLACAWVIIRPTTVWGPWNFVHVNGFFRILRSGFYIHPGRVPVLKSYGYVGNVVYQIVRLLEASAESVDKQTFYVGDPPIDLRKWVDEFSLKLRGRKTRSAPIWALKALGLFGDFLGMFDVKFPLTSFRLKNMTVENIIHMDDLLAVTGPSPYSLEAGVEETVKWLKSYEMDCHA
jgi:GlcNAc-P-P-Und epimerase